MANTGNTQQIIDYGATANDGLGDPLRTAFTKTEENFDNIWLAGPVGSNITIVNNTIGVQNTNGNLTLAPNGVGVIESRNSILPWIDSVYDLGGPNNYWRNVYASGISSDKLTISKDLLVGGNLMVSGNIIEMGNIVTDALTVQLANTTTTREQANGAGIVVGANGNIATFVYDSVNNQWNTGDVLISGNSVRAAGKNYYIQFNRDNVLDSSGELSYNPVQKSMYLGNSLFTIYNSGNAWAINNNYIASPAGGGWFSNKEFLTEFITSPANGYIDLTSRLNGNDAASMHIDHGYISWTLSDGNTSIWQFNSDGNTYFPFYSFPNTTPSPDQSLIANATGNLVWTTIKVNEIFNGTSNVTIPDANGVVYINANNQQWVFDNVGNLTTPGNIIPDTSNAYSLGNATNQWRDLYVSNTTIYINNVPVGLTENNVLTVDGQPVLSNDSDTSINTTGSISAANITLNGIGTAVNVSSGNILTNQVTGTQFNFLNGLQTVSINAGQATSNYTLCLPANAGIDGQMLTTDGTGNLSWTTSSPSFGGQIAFTGVLTPAALTTNTDDWNPAGLATCNFLRASATTDVSLTGIQAPSPAANQMIMVVNLGPGNIDILRNNAGSAAANRFINNNDVLLNANEAMVMMYDAVSLGWRIFGIQN